MAVTLDQTLELATANSCVCPQPYRWSRMYELLPETRREGAGFVPPAPLILAAWGEASDRFKAERLREHIEWAAAHGALDRIHKYLAGLPENEWHHAA